MLNKKWTISTDRPLIKYSFDYKINQLRAVKFTTLSLVWIIFEATLIWFLTLQEYSNFNSKLQN